MQNVKLISHPLIEHKLTILRDKNTQPFQFRMLVDEISYLMIFEATRNLKVKEVKVQTPVALADAKRLTIIPDASVGFLGFQRNEETAQAEFFYAKLPKDAKERMAIIIDPMFATGGTAIDAVKFLREKGVKEIKFISIIAAPEGLKRFSEIYPDVEVYTASIDEKLNEKNYIVPGLGDAGDRVFNTL